jgi:hypothetical protein
MHRSAMSCVDPCSGSKMEIDLLEGYAFAFTEVAPQWWRLSAEDTLVSFRNDSVNNIHREEHESCADTKDCRPHQQRVNNPLWNRFFVPGDMTTLVAADSSLVLMRHLSPARHISG